jgi:seryl-tRNA synthetase
MSHLSEIVDLLETRVTSLVETHLKMKQKNAEMEDELTLLKSQQRHYKVEVEAWKKKHDTLKFANSILGSDEHKRDTKLKINALIREIDQCITELSE